MNTAYHFDEPLIPVAYLETTYGKHIIHQQNLKESLTIVRKKGATIKCIP